MDLTANQKKKRNRKVNVLKRAEKKKYYSLYIVQVVIYY